MTPLKQQIMPNITYTVIPFSVEHIERTTGIALAN